MYKKITMRNFFSTTYKIDSLLKKALYLLFMISIFMLYGSRLSGQCVNVTLTSQTDVDNFNCTTVTGNLVIKDDDDGVDDIVDFSTAFLNLTSVNGDLDIDGNKSLVVLEGFDQLSTVGGMLRIRSNFDLTTIEDFPSLTSIGGNFAVAANFSVVDFTGFPALQTIGNRFDIFWTGTNSITGFNALTSIGSTLFFNESDFIEISGFENLSTVGGDFDIYYNTNLTTVNAFENITNISSSTYITDNDDLSNCCWMIPVIDATQGSVNMSGNLIGCNDPSQIGQDPPEITCPADFSLNTDPGVCEVDMSITDPTPTDDCEVVSATYARTSPSGAFGSGPLTPGYPWIQTLNELGDWIYEYTATDGNGQTSSCTTIVTVSDMEAPVINCPADFTLQTDPGMCTANNTVNHPSPTDNCSVSSLSFSLVDGLGNTVYNNSPVTSGSSEVFDLPTGTNNLSYTTTDASGNPSDCSYIITVEDDEAPTWTNPNNMITLNGECGIDDPLAMFNNNMGVAVDNCGGATAVLDNTVVNPVCGAAEQHIFTMLATDNSGNVSVPYTVTINLDDTQDPVLSAVPADVTINCNDPLPNAPLLTASDQCSGDISADIVVASSITQGTCTYNTPAEIHSWTYDVDDGCGNSDNAVWTLTILNDFTINLGPDIAECDQNSEVLNAGPGVSYLWSTGETTQTITVNSSGTYDVTVTSNNGCCASDDIVVSFGSSPDASANGAQLDCNGNAVQIFGNSTTPGVSYSWTGPGNYTSSMQNPFVTDAGTYTLTVSTTAGCTSTADAVVTTNTNVPDISAQGGTITCADETVTLMVSSNTSGVSYSWTGPNGFTSNQQNPIVFQTGTYTAQVMGSNGCIATATVEVDLDDTAPTASIIAELITCTNPLSQISTTASPDAVTFDWDGPFGWSSTDQNPIVPAIGTYNLTVTGNNGCSNMYSIVVEEDIEEPNVSATGGTLDCSSGLVQLFGNSTTAGAIYSWAGPGGFTSNLQNPTVSQIGIYTLTVTAPNTCTAWAQGEVTEDINAPEISVTGGELNCNINSIVLTSSSSIPNSTFAWTGPNNFTSNVQSPEVTTSGTYTLTVTAPNGCSSMEDVEVSSNYSEPNANLSFGEAACDATSIQIILDIVDNSGVSYAWNGPSNFSSSEQSPSVTELGTYTVQMTGNNGCQSSQTIVLTQNEFKNSPQVETTAGMLTCFVFEAQLTASSTDPVVSYQWTGPNGFSSMLQNPWVSVIGTYTVEVLGSNGCITSQDVVVESASDVPDIMTTGGHIDCANPEVQIMGSSTTDEPYYEWEGPNNFSSTEQNPFVSEPGSYKCTVYAGNGCSTFDFATVTSDFEAPFVETTLGTEIDCQGKTRSLDAITNDPEAEVIWSGPNNYFFDELTAHVTDAGLYTVEITSANGCSSTSSIELEESVNVTVDITTTESEPDNPTGTAFCQVTSGTPSFLILWDNGGNGVSTDDLAVGIHTVTIQDGLDCETEFDFEIESTVSNTHNPEWATQINIYPNPTQDVVHIQLPSDPTKIKEIAIYSLNGQRIKTFQSIGLESTFTIDVQSFESGVYLIEMVGEQGIFTQRLNKI